MCAACASTWPRATRAAYGSDEHASRSGPMAAASPTPGRAAGPRSCASGGTSANSPAREPATTNNRMELTAAAAALEALKRPCRVVLHTDSEYLPQRHHPLAPGLGAPQLAQLPTATRSPTWTCGSACWRRRRATAIDWRWVRGHAGRRDERARRRAGHRGARGRAGGALTAREQQTHERRAPAGTRLSLRPG